MNHLVAWAALISSLRHGVPVQQTWSILRIESQYCKYTHSTTNDLGCMQINIKTARALKLNVKALKYDNWYNIDEGVKILKSIENKRICLYNVGRLTKKRYKSCLKYERRYNEIHNTVAIVERGGTCHRYDGYRRHGEKFIQNRIPLRW